MTDNEETAAALHRRWTLTETLLSALVAVQVAGLGAAVPWAYTIQGRLSTIEAGLGQQATIDNKIETLRGIIAANASIISRNADRIDSSNRERDRLELRVDKLIERVEKISPKP